MKDLGLTINKADQTVEFECVYEDSGDPMGITLTLVGPDTDQFAKAARNASQARESLARVQRGNVRPKQHEEINITLLATITTAWAFKPPAIAKDGKAPEFTPSNVKALYTQYTEIATQVDNFAVNRGNFRSGGK